MDGSVLRHARCILQFLMPGYDPDLLADAVVRQLAKTQDDQQLASLQSRLFKAKPMGDVSDKAGNVLALPAGNEA